VYVELYQTIGRDQVALEPRFPAGSEFGREFFAFGIDSRESGANSRNNFRALPRIPCLAVAGNLFCARREFFMGGRDLFAGAGNCPALFGFMELICQRVGRISEA